MIVKTLKKTAALAMLLSAATAANANEFGMKKFSAGLDVMGTTLDWTATGGKNIFPKNPIGAGVFVAADFYNYSEFNVGAELGVEYIQKTKKSKLVAGQAMNYGTLGVDSSASFTTKLKVITPYLGLTGSYNVNPQLKVIAMIGAGAAVSTVNQTQTSLMLANVIAPAADYANIPEFKKTAILPIVRLGAQYNVNETIGVRANVSYRYMKTLNSKIKRDNTIYSFEAKNSLLNYGVGIVFSF